MKKWLFLLCAVSLLGCSAISVDAKGPLPPLPLPGRMTPPGHPGLPPPPPRTPLPKTLRQIQVARPTPLPGSPPPPPPIRMNPPSPYQMVPPPPAHQPGELPVVRLYPPSPYQSRVPVVPRVLPQPQRTSPLGPYRLGPVVSFTSLSYLSPLPHRTAPVGPMPTVSEQRDMHTYWQKVQDGTATVDDRKALETLVRKYPNYDFAR